MFGEPGAAGERPGFEAIEERVAWWAEVFEAPCVGYAASHDEIAPLVKAGADFVALGDWLWRDPQAIAATIARAAGRPAPAGERGMRARRRSTIVALCALAALAAPALAQPKKKTPPPAAAARGQCRKTARPTSPMARFSAAII